jgi:nitrile hydratase
MVASNANAPTKFLVVENTLSTSHWIVCTLCSCYPSSILGMAPSWYKSRSYRARAIREPRKVLLEFGLILQQEMSLVVHDSTADCRYIVPEGTEGWGEMELMGIVTRDCLLGVVFPRGKISFTVKELYG